MSKPQTRSALEHVLTFARYINLQEEYIKDEQRYDSYRVQSLHDLVLNKSQKSEERVGSSSGGDQANTKRTFGDRTIYGSY